MLQLIAVASVIVATSLGGQMSVTTIGATDARLCYDDAASGVTTSTASCDMALKDQSLSGRDRRATLVNRGIVLNRAGLPNEAMADFDKALDGAPDLAEALLNRGNSKYLLRRFDDAIIDYEAALNLGLTKKHVGWYNIGLAYEAKKEVVKAKAAYRTALEHSPDFGPALRKLETAPAEG